MPNIGTSIEALRLICVRLQFHVSGASRSRLASSATGEALVGEAGLEASLKTSNLTCKNGQALLCDELKKAKEDKDNAKKAAKQAAKVEKNCLKRRARLLKARHGSFRSGGLLSPNKVLIYHQTMDPYTPRKSLLVVLRRNVLSYRRRQRGCQKKTYSFC